MLKPSLHLNYRHGHGHLLFIRRALLTRTHLSRPLLAAGGNMGLSNINAYPSEALLVQTTQQSGWYPSYVK